MISQKSFETIKKVSTENVKRNKEILVTREEAVKLKSLILDENNPLALAKAFKVISSSKNSTESVEILKDTISYLENRITDS